METFDVSGSIKLPLSIAVLNVAPTGDKGADSVASILFATIKCRRWTADGAVRRATCLEELDVALSGLEHANTVLLITHGDLEGAEELGTIQIGEEWFYWDLAEQMFDGLADKLICLCVCYGDNEDTRRVILGGRLRGLFLVAPKTIISGQEAICFYPELYDCLSAVSGGEVDLNQLVACVQAKNSLANNKMVASVCEGL